MKKTPTKSHTIRDNTIILEDAISGMNKLETGSVDLAIADPPYSASSATPSQLISNHGLEGFGGQWTAASHDWDFLDLNHNMSFTMAWLSELKRLVKPEGSIWIHSTYHNSGIVNVACQALGLEIINEVVWFKRNSFPNLRATRLTASHETILWVHTGGSKRRYRFNYADIKKAQYEGDRLKEADKQMRTVWDIPNNKTRQELSLGKHPTQKPERVIQRLLDISAPESGLLLSPFLGSGTDLVVGMRNGLNGIGFELNQEYFDLAASRLDAESADVEGKLFQ
jgi:site-specific DNA-methyltransferase (adenine-specific)